MAGKRIWGLAALVLALAASACGGSTPTAQTGPIKVVAGQNFWGSIATQLGGSKASVQSVVTDPNADPHEYESNTNDARAVADAGFVILNGAGYDDWANKLLSANPSSHRTVLVAADLLGKKAGDNPHFWYNPDYVTRMADKMTADYKSIDPGRLRLLRPAAGRLRHGAEAVRSAPGRDQGKVQRCGRSPPPRASSSTWRQPSA